MTKNDIQVILVLSLLFWVTFYLAGCTSFKLVHDNGDSLVYSRLTGQRCMKLYDGFSQDSFYSGYGQPCEIEIRREIK